MSCSRKVTIYFTSCTGLRLVLPIKKATRVSQGVWDSNKGSNDVNEFHNVITLFWVHHKFPQFYYCNGLMTNVV